MTIRQSSGDLRADRRHALAASLAAEGDPAAAADLMAQALELCPGWAAGWFARGDWCVAAGDRDGAVQAFDRVMALDPQDPFGAGLRLAVLGRGAADRAMTNAYLRSLFDGYAARFDRALVDGLDYRGPSLILAALDRAGARPPFRRVLDLGCGTGLMAEALRPLATRLEGCDLSDGMVARARDKGVYDAVEVADMDAFLDEQLPASADLVTAADVFVYRAALEPLLAAIARVLQPGGHLAFTVERHDGDGVMLRETLRYAHDRKTVEAGLAAAGFAGVDVAAVSTRREKGVDVPGLVVVARQPA